MSTSSIGPVTGNERIQYWDVLRGVAVLGVLMANMPLMSIARALDWHTADLSHGALDTFGFGFVRFFADTKFITIFSLLFGAGLAFLSEKFVQRGQPFRRMYARRLATLALLGILHIGLLWFGDILLHYAMWGFVAMWLRRFRPRTLCIVAGVLLALYAGVSVFMATLDPKDFIELTEGGTFAEHRAERTREFAEVLSSGDFATMAHKRLELALEALVFMNLLWGGRTLALFLLGMALVKSGLLMRVAEHRTFWRRCVVVGLSVGVPLQIVHLFWATASATPADRAIGSLTMYLVALFLSPAYMGLVALWTLTDRARWLQDRLGAVGRMALTSYLSHSIITAILFNYLGLYDRLDRFGGLVITFLIYAFQLWISPLWLARFRFGPFEWLWRSATYLSWPPMRPHRYASRTWS